MECQMDHIVLNVKDPEKMIRFYSKVLLLTAERLEKFRSGSVPFPSVRLNPDTIIDLFPPQMWQTSPPAGQTRENLNHFCIAVSKGEWDRLLDRLKVYSIEIEEGPVQRWGAHGTGISVYFRDPENNRIEARYYETPADPKDCLLSS